MENIFIITDKMFTDTGIEVTKLVENEKTKVVETRAEAVRLTERIGYYYPVLDTKKKYNRVWNTQVTINKKKQNGKNTHNYLWSI